MRGADPLNARTKLSWGNDFIRCKDSLGRFLKGICFYVTTETAVLKKNPLNLDIYATVARFLTEFAMLTHIGNKESINR